MPERDKPQWSRYNDQQAGREVRPLLVLAASHAGPGRGRVALDLGCGDGVETRWLLERGWAVHALDSDEHSLRRLREASESDGGVSALQTWSADLNALPPVPTADLVYSGYALPFTDADRFADTWRAVRDALTPGGVLAVNLFGDRDSWATSGQGTYLTETEARALLDGLQILQFQIQDEQGMAMSGPKHWHVFDVIARRPADQP